MRFIWILFFFVTVSSNVRGNVFPNENDWTENPKPTPPRLELDWTGPEYWMWKKHLDSLQPELKIQTLGPLQDVVMLGEANLAWLSYMNRFRDPKLSITSRETMASIPMERPRIYNEQIIVKNQEKLWAELPVEIKNILTKNLTSIVGFPKTPPVPEAEYIAWALRIDRQYQIAVRWQMMSQYLPTLAERRHQDIRGYFFLNQQPQLEQKLKDWKSLEPEIQDQFKIWLVGVCRNLRSYPAAPCSKILNKAIINDEVFNFYQKYSPYSQSILNSFFDFYNPRPEIQWTHENANIALAPFRSPQIAAVQEYLAFNIQDEWKWDGWNLMLQFVETTGNIPHVKFVAGTTPHVNGIGGNEITMDSNAPLTEWDVQWTIRHEYGHVLGFVDCYLEFYDEELKAIVNYQIDISDLMCSRTGRFKQRHFDQLKLNYFRENGAALNTSNSFAADEIHE